MMEIVGLSFSLVAIAVFIGLLLDWRRRRGRFDARHVAGRRVEADVVQWIWLAVIVGSFTLALSAPGVALVTDERQVIEAPTGPASEPAPRVRSARRVHMVMLPFYRYGRTVRTTAGTVESVAITRQIVLPVWFIAGSVLYWLLVMRRPRPANGVAEGRSATTRS